MSLTRLVLGWYSRVASSHHDRQAFEFRKAQQFDGREKGIHVDVGDAARTRHTESVFESRR
jgi:hypothetical protein